MNLEEHISGQIFLLAKNRAIEEEIRSREKQRVESAEKTGYGKLADDLNLLKGEMESRRYDVFNGRGFAGGHFDGEKVADWSYSEDSKSGIGPLADGPSENVIEIRRKENKISTAYPYRESLQKIEGGLYLPKWDISLPDTFLGSIGDYQTVLFYMERAEDGTIKNYSSRDLQNEEDNSRFSEIVKRFTKKENDYLDSGLGRVSLI